MLTEFELNDEKFSIMFTFNAITIVILLLNVSINCYPSHTIGLNQILDIPREQIRYAEATVEEKPTYRLPNTIIPEGYDLRICPFLEKDFLFAGEVYIRVFSFVDTYIVKLHSYGLSITGAYMRTRVRVWSPISYKLDPQNQLLILNSTYLVRANITSDFHISFIGALNDQMRGFYRSYYKVGDSIKWLATTQFESTSARFAFPCFDEPQFKAVFSVSIARYKNQVALSNMPLKYTSSPDRNLNNRVWDTFEYTPKMPTYLVAFMVTEYKSISPNTDDFAVWARENAINDGEYASIIGEEILNKMEDFTGIDYSLPKMDMAAIPDFNGAMENWGLSTYNEQWLLYNKKLSTERNKEHVTTVIAHELAHQWFGDYVTPIWWDYLWLKEGFATYFEYHITDKVQPTWRMNELFTKECCQFALYNDGVTVHHALNAKVESPDEISDIYDVISYYKGGCIIRMLEHMVSTSTFKKALNLFLTSGYAAGGLVTSDNLWNAFDTQIKLDSVLLPDQTNISLVMKSWTEEIGYPLITTERKMNGETVEIIVKQTRYKSSRSLTAPPDNYWIVPLTFTTKGKINFSNTKPLAWSVPHKELIIEKNIGVNDWIILNIQQTGYYRVNYDRENWKLLIKQLKESPNVIHPSNRAHLIDDSLSLAIDDKLPFAISFDLLDYLEYESDAIPWFSATQKLDQLLSQFAATIAGPDLRYYYLQKINHIYKKIGFTNKKNDAHLTKTFRSSMITIACNLGHRDCVQEAKMKYHKNKNNISQIPPDVKNAVFCTVLRSDESETMWNKMWTLYYNSNVAHEKGCILNTLGCTKNEILLKKYLLKLINVNDTDVRPQDKRNAYQSLFSTDEGVMVGLKYTEEILPELDNLNQKEYYTVLRMLMFLNSKIRTTKQVSLLNKLVSDCKKLNQTKHADFIKTINFMQKAAVRRIEYNKIKSEQIFAGLQGIILEIPKSSASYLAPSIASGLLFTLLQLWLLHGKFLLFTYL